MMKLLKEKNIEADLPRPTFEELKRIYMGNVDKIFSRSVEQYPVPN